MSYKTDKVNELLARFEAELGDYAHKPCRIKELVFAEVGVLKAAGYVEDVAFSKALQKFGFCR